MHVYMQREKERGWTERKRKRTCIFFFFFFSFLFFFFVLFCVTAEIVAMRRRNEKSHWWSKHVGKTKKKRKKKKGKSDAEGRMLRQRLFVVWSDCKVAPLAPPRREHTRSPSGKINEMSYTLFTLAEFQSTRVNRPVNRPVKTWKRKKGRLSRR